MNIENIIFVCQEGRLELESRLLCSSIRYKLGYKVQVIAAVPHDISLLSHQTIGLLRELDVQIREIKNPSFHKYSNHRDKPYLHGNKIDACQQFTADGINLLIDTDTILFQELPDLDLSSNSVAGCKARGLSCSLFKEGNELRLQEVYSLFSSSSDSPLYSNSGVIFYHSDSKFSELWYEITHAIINNNELTVKEKFPWADQVSFSIINGLKDINYTNLSPREFNNPYPGWQLNKPLPNEPTCIYHYHNFWNIFRNSRTIEYLLELEQYLDSKNCSFKIFNELPIAQSKLSLSKWHEKMYKLKLEIKKLEQELNKY